MSICLRYSCLPLFVFFLPGRVPLLLLLPHRVVVAVVATVTPLLCAVVAEPPTCFHPFLSSFSPLFCVLFWMQAMIAVWTSLSSDTASSDHIVGSLSDEATTRILEPIDNVACLFFLNRMSCCFPLLFCCCFLPRLLPCHGTCTCFTFRVVFLVLVLLLFHMMRIFVTRLFCFCR